MAVAQAELEDADRALDRALRDSASPDLIGRQQVNLGF